MQPTSQLPQVPPLPASSEQVQKTNKLKLIWGVVCLVGPTALLIISILLFALLSFIDSTQTPPSAPSESESLFGESSPAHTITNVILYLVGAVSALTWLPGVIIGIILLTSRKRA